MRASLMPWGGAGRQRAAPGGETEQAQFFHCLAIQCTTSRNGAPATVWAIGQPTSGQLLHQLLQYWEGLLCAAPGQG